MKTNKVLMEYMRNPGIIPNDGWRRLVWYAAGMMRMAMDMRNTSRVSRAKRMNAKGGFTQGDLFS